MTGENGPADGDRGERSVLAIGLAGIGAYVTTYLVLQTVLVDAESYRGVTEGELTELLLLGGFGSISMEFSLIALPDSYNYAELAPELVGIVGTAAAIPLAAAGYVVAKRGRPYSGRRAAAKRGATVAVPYAAIVWWRATEFGRTSFQSVDEAGIYATAGGGSATVTRTTEIVATAEPGTALLVAGVGAAIACGAGGLLAHWRHGQLNTADRTRGADVGEPET